MERKSQNSRRKFLIKYSLLKWNKIQIQHLQLQANFEHAISHRELTIAKQTFNHWKAQVKKSKDNLEKLKKFNSKSEIRKIRVALKTWRSETNRKIDSNYLISCALSNNLDSRFLLR